MSPQLADVTRQQLTRLKAARFARGVAEHGATELTIMLGPDGKIAGLLFRPA